MRDQDNEHSVFDRFEDEQSQDVFEAFGVVENEDVLLSDVADELGLTDEEVETPAFASVADETIAADDQYEEEALEPRELDQMPRPIKAGFSWTALCGGLVALLWMAGAIAGPLSFYGVDAIMTLDPAMQAGLIALAFGPAVLFWLGATAAGEALKARRIAGELARMAQEAQAPFTAGAAHAQRLSHNVKSEIDALNDAVATALTRLNDLETAARRNVAVFDNAINGTRENCDVMADQLARERTALTELNGELRGQTDAMSHSIGRQVRLMREASKLVKTEITSAEESLTTQMVSFVASAKTMADHTATFRHVADDAAAATAALNGTMSDMLDSLGEATKLTDCARASAHDARLAATETANAVRDTTRHAVHEAKRAAQAIRAETAALQDTAAETLSRLQAAADAARAASEESYAAADRHAASIEKRLSALATTATAARKPAPQPAPRVVERPIERPPARSAERPVERPVERRAERPIERKPAPQQTRADADDSARYSAAAAAMARGQARVQSASAAAADRIPTNGLKGVNAWGNMFPNTRIQETDDDFAFEAANAPEDSDAFDFADFGTPKRSRDPETVLKNDAIDLVFHAGVDLDHALSAVDLDRIAQQSRRGVEARRRAVFDAAPSAVSRVARHIKRNSEAQHIANDFRARPHLTKSELKAEASDLIRAYLLIDAALAS